MKKISLIGLCFVFYLISTVPVGLFLYSLKTENDIDVFSNTGFHAYMSCLKNEAEKALQPHSDDRSVGE